MATNISSPKSQMLATSPQFLSLLSILVTSTACRAENKAVTNFFLHHFFRTVSRKCLFRFHIDLSSPRTQRLRAHAISDNDEKKTDAPNQATVTVNRNVPLLIENVTVYRHNDVGSDYCLMTSKFM